MRLCDRLTLTAATRQHCFLDLVQQGFQFARGGEIANLRRALFIRGVRRFRGGEFLKARIVSQRIKHWIEPEQCGRKRDAKIK